MAAKKKSTDARRLAIVADPIWKRWQSALRAYERALQKRSRNEIEQAATWKASEKALDAYNWLRALPLDAAELAEELSRLNLIASHKQEAEDGAAAVRAGERRAALGALDEERDNDPHTRYVPGLGYARGRRLL